MSGAKYIGNGNFEGFENGFDKFPWKSYGDANWIVTSDNAYSGNYSARAGAIGDSQLPLNKLGGL